MNKPSPRLIGIFVTAALVLLVGMILFFGSSSLLSKNTRFVLFFDQSVNGLNVGSLVKYRGVPIGAVERILIRAEGQDPESTAIPVVVRIDRTRLEKDLGVMDTAFDPSNVQDAIRKGLVGELSLESFITGQLFVEFSFDRERSRGATRHLVGESEIMEIPTLGSSLDEITDDLAQLVASAGAIDLERLNENVNQVLENLSGVLAGINSDEISRSVTAAADSVSEFVDSESLASALSSIEEALDQIATTAASYDLTEGPLAQTVETWTTEFSETLDGLNRVSAQLGILLDPDSSMRFEFEKMLRELSRAAQSIRVLADYLERNPNALLTGRAENDD
jgi:paraquat-inducible protein B